MHVVVMHLYNKHSVFIDLFRFTTYIPVEGVFTPAATGYRRRAGKRLLTTGLLPTLCGLKLGLLVAGMNGLIVDSFWKK